MRHSIFLLALLSFAVPLFTAQAEDEPGKSKLQEKSLKVLTIGNSFAQSLFVYLPDVVKSVHGCSLELDKMNIAGCPLRKHWENIEKEEADPSYKYFKTFSYKEKLQSQKWDIVSIQQSSNESWDYAKYMPYAKNLYDYIKKHAPQAEVVIQQTWAYRQDEPRLARWGFCQEEMFKRLFAAYNKAGEELNLRIIPVGSAVQLARETQELKYKPFKSEDYIYPELPDTAPSLVGNIKWSDDHKKLIGDAAHLNKRGEYLQACVWFSMLYGISPEKITLNPKELKEEDAEFLRAIAKKTISDFKQGKK